MNILVICVIILVLIIIGFKIDDRSIQEERKIKELQKINMREQRKEIEMELDALEIELKEKIKEFDKE